jgi:hypothetical protein
VSFFESMSRPNLNLQVRESGDLSGSSGEEKLLAEGLWGGGRSFRYVW